MEETQVTVLEATNSLLVNATREQHVRLATVLARVDVVQQDLRAFKIYEIKHVDAFGGEKAARGVSTDRGESNGKDKPAAAVVTAAATPAVAGQRRKAEENRPPSTGRRCPCWESTIIAGQATQFQHARIATVVKHVDSAARDEAIPYEIYFLEPGPRASGGSATEDSL